VIQDIDFPIVKRSLVQWLLAAVWRYNFGMRKAKNGEVIIEQGAKCCRCHREIPDEGKRCVCFAMDEVKDYLAKAATVDRGLVFAYIMDGYCEKCGRELSKYGTFTAPCHCENDE
jgi:hypothetical protein